MRSSTLIVLSGLLAAIGFTVMAADKPSDGYVKAMKDLGTVSQALDKTIAAENYDALAKFGETAATALGVAEVYWTGKDDDSKKAASTGRKAAMDLQVAAGLKSAEGVAFAATELTGTCAGCHAAHREKLPDGTFQIK